MEGETEVLLRQTKVDEFIVARIQENMLKLAIGDGTLDVAHPRSKKNETYPKNVSFTAIKVISCFINRRCKVIL